MPRLEITRPPHQHSADTTPALRGPACSSQPPNSAVDSPRNTKNSVNIQPSIEIFLRLEDFDAGLDVHAVLRVPRAVDRAVRRLARARGAAQGRRGVRAVLVRRPGDLEPRHLH